MVLLAPFAPFVTMTSHGALEALGRLDPVPVSRVRRPVVQMPGRLLTWCRTGPTKDVPAIG